MMPAAKHLDPILGIDIHLIQPPGPVPPLPIPHPHIGLVFDPADYIPIVGSTISIHGIPRAMAGTAGKTIPSHIPIGGTFIKPPGNENEMFMGSSTVAFDGDAASYMALPNLSCQDIGMIAPFRSSPKKKTKMKSMVLPTSVVLPIPTGPPVLIGGAPTISLMGFAMKVGIPGFGKGLKRLAKIRLVRSLGAAVKGAKQRFFRNMKPGFIKCKVLRAEPVDSVTGEVVVDQQDFSIAGRIPIEWNRHYGSQSERMGVCGHGWETPADTRLECESNESIVFHDGTGVASYFESLPLDGPVMEPVDGGLLSREGDFYTVRMKTGQTYFFRISKERWDQILIDFVQDPHGNRLTFVRDLNGLKAVVESAGRQIDVVSRGGFVKEMRLRYPGDPTPHPLVRFEYNDSGDLIAVYDALNVPYRFHYQNHCLVQHTDRNELSFYYEYDEYLPDGRCYHAWGDGGLYNYQFKYHVLEGVTEMTDSLGHPSTVKYNNRYQIVQEIDALGGKTLYEYDDQGRTTAVVDPESHRTEYTYDERGNLLKLTRPDGKSILTEFNDADKAVQITDPNGAAWKQEWSTLGLLTQQVTPLNAASHYTYDLHGQLSAFTNPMGADTALSYDSYGRLVHLTDPLIHSTQFFYDKLGNVTAKTNPLGQRTHYAYDAKGRLTEVVLPSRVSIVCAYDGQDNLIRYQDENGAVTRLEYGGLGEIKHRLQPDGHSVEYHYNTEEQLIGVTNQRGERYELKRDALGRIAEEIDYWGQGRRYRYTKSGALKESVDPLDRMIQYETDSLGRILKKILPDPNISTETQSECFEYDPNGNLTVCENKAIRMERKFDLEGRLLEEKQGEACTVANAYDANGNRIARTSTREMAGYGVAQTVRYGYDLLNQAIRVEAEGHVPIDLTRNALGQLTQERLGARVQRHLDYSPDGHLTAQRLITVEGPVFEQNYRYDRAGNLIEKRDSVIGIDQYTYDPVGRLTAHLDPQGHLKQYLNDPAGDRLRTRVREPLPEGQEADWCREGEYEDCSYRFDRAGNLVERKEPKKNDTFLWDGNQRLIESTTHGQTTNYHYDPLGRRVRKQTGNTTTHFCWDGDALLGDAVIVDGQETVPTPRLIREWVYYPETFEPLILVQGGGTDPANVATPSDIYLYHNDPNGCPTRLVDKIGKVVWAAQYLAWGKAERLHVNRVDNPIRMQGQYEDSETGLHYNRYRYYDPCCGIFVSQDPIGLAGGLNIYQYAFNTIKWIDPLGLSCTPKDAQKKVRRGQGPREIVRIDAPESNIPGSQWHAHGTNGGAINLNGSIHDSDPLFSNKTLSWLRKHGWNV